MPIRITSWNVNGIRNPFSYPPWNEKRTFQAMFDTLEADIVIMQEVKIQREHLTDDMVLVPGWDVYFSLPRHKKGYSGVAIYTRTSKVCPIRAEEGLTGFLSPPKSSTRYRDLPFDQQIGGYPRPDQLPDIDVLLLDSEGRCVLLEFPAFVLMGVYVHSRREDEDNNTLQHCNDVLVSQKTHRRQSRDAFVDLLDVRVRNLVAAGKQVVLAGDLNITSSLMDCYSARKRLVKYGITEKDWFSEPPRRVFNQLVFGGRVVGARDENRDKAVMWDLCRSFHPARQAMFTCWDNKKNHRPANLGTRIDHVLCSDGVKSWFVDADIQEGLLGSDHCPVFGVLGDTVDDVSLLVLMNPDNMFGNGERLREWTPRDALPLSARRILEFDGRRDIRDMFAKTGAKRPASPLSKPHKMAKSTFSPLGSQTKGLSFSRAEPTEATETTEATATEATSANDDSLPTGPVFDPVAKNAWSRLLGKRQPPLCEHDEPCQLRVTKKPGMNNGRSFYMCKRLPGPSGEKEKGTEWQCPTFIWSSDWKPRA